MSRISMGKHKGLLFVLAVAGAAAVSVSVLPALAGGPAAVAAVDPGTDAKALAKLDDDWSNAAATKDAEKVASFYADDAIAYPPNEPLSTGRAAAKKVWASYFSEPSFSISWKTLHSEVAASGDVGFTSGSYQLSFKGPDGKAVTDKGKYLCVWKQQKDGSWKAAHDMWNSDAK